MRGVKLCEAFHRGETRKANSTVRKVKQSEFAMHTLPEIWNGRFKPVSEQVEVAQRRSFQIIVHGFNSQLSSRRKMNKRTFEIWAIEGKRMAKKKKEKEKKESVDTKNKKKTKREEPYFKTRA